MKVLECAQNTPEWFSHRVGIPTASYFDRILTPTGQPSKQAEGYMHLLLAEAITGQRQGFEGNAWTERGHELEEEARQLYAFLTGNEVAPVGFCVHDDRHCGASPDGLVGEDGQLELKCPAPQTQVKYLLQNRFPLDYVPQVQGQLYVTGRPWADFMTYSPGLPPLLIHVERDEKYIGLLDAELRKFSKELQRKAEELRKRLS